MSAAVILAAGAGVRLGGVAKALLRIGDVTFLRRIVETAREAGCEEALVVVAAPFGEVVAAEARALGARVIVNAEPVRGMASSLALGFAALVDPGNEMVAGRHVEFAWLWPVDHPHVTVDTLRALQQALGDHDVARPRYRGQGGHPPLIARRAWARLAACDGVDGGARAVIATLDVIDVAVEDAGVVRDIDTADDVRGPA